MKLSLMTYVSCTTKCYQVVLRNEPNFIDIVTLVTLHMRAKILVFRSVSLRHEQTDQAVRWKVPELITKRPEASCRQSCRIAFAGDAHTFADILIKPCVLELATCVLGEQSRKELEIVQLFGNNVRRDIHELSEDTKKNNWCRYVNRVLLLLLNLTN